MRALDWSNGKLRLPWGNLVQRTFINGKCAWIIKSPRQIGTLLASTSFRFWRLDAGFTRGQESPMFSTIEDMNMRILSKHNISWHLADAGSAPAWSVAARKPGPKRRSR